MPTCDIYEKENCHDICDIGVQYFFQRPVPTIVFIGPSGPGFYTGWQLSPLIAFPRLRGNGAINPFYIAPIRDIFCDERWPHLGGVRADSF